MHAYIDIVVTVISVDTFKVVQNTEHAYEQIKENLNTQLEHS